jgi:hypothetical protein
MNTLEDMSEVAKKTGIAKKAVQEIMDVEDRIATDEHMTDENVSIGFKGIVQYATIAADAAREAVSILRSIKANIEAYRGSI